MRRILITGNSGAGKSTLGKKISEKLDIPLIHMDIHYWRPGWERLDRETWRERVSELVKGDQWIMEGNFVNTLDIRLPKATHLIHLDFPGLKCLYRCLKRRFLTGKNTRQDLPKGCYEKIDFDFYKFVLEYPKEHSLKVYSMVDRYFQGEFLVAKSDKEVTETIELLV